MTPQIEEYRFWIRISNWPETNYTLHQKCVRMAQEALRRTTPSEIYLKTKKRIEEMRKEVA